VAELEHVSDLDRRRKVRDAEVVRTVLTIVYRRTTFAA
jgi:hypothetical protein